MKKYISTLMEMYKDMQKQNSIHLQEEGKKKEKFLKEKPETMTYLLFH